MVRRNDAGEWVWTDRALARAASVFAVAGVVISVTSAWTTTTIRLNSSASNQRVDSVVASVRAVEATQEAITRDLRVLLARSDSASLVLRGVLRVQCISTHPEDRALFLDGVDCGRLPYRPRP